MANTTSTRWSRLTSLMINHFNCVNFRNHVIRMAFYFCIFFFFLFFSPILGLQPAAYGSSWVRGWIRAVPEAYITVTATFATYARACSNSRSLIHWVRSGIQPHTHRHHNGFLTYWVTMGTPHIFIIFPKILYLQSIPVGEW